MIDRRIAKIKLRRGTESERSLVVFEQGELVYTTDTKRLYVGDGVTYGGSRVNNKVTIDATLFPGAPATTDIFYREDEGRAHIYNGTTWVPIGGPADDTSIEYINSFKVKDGGIQREHIGSTVFRIDGGLSSLSAEGIFINFDPTQFEVVGGVFKLLPGPGPILDPGGGLENTPSGLATRVDDDSIYLLGNKITVKNINNNHILGGITPDKISSNFVNSNFGLSASNNDGIYIKTNTDHLNFEPDGRLKLNLTPLSSQKSINGYQVLHNDFVMQWGQTSGLSANKFITIVFPLTTWNCYNVQTTMGYNVLINNNFVPIIKNITLSSFDVALDYSATTPSPTETATIYWTAVGYL